MSKQFAEFRVGDVLSITPTVKPTVVERKGSYIKDDEVVEEGGKIPYIAAISTNNGIKGWTNITPRNSAGSITLSTTADSSNTVFYQPVDYVGRQQVAKIQHNDSSPLSFREAMYLSTLLKKITQSFNYGNKLTRGGLEDSTITLPVTDESAGTESPEPDWEYMETYIKEIEEKYLDSVVKYNKRNGEILDTLYPDYNGSVPEAYDYAEFRVGDLFTQIKKTSKGRGFAKSQIETDEFSLPGLSATNTNNGFGFYLNPNEHDALVDCITVSANGVNTGYTAYQSSPFGIAQDAYALRLKNTGNTRRQHLYCVAALNKNNALKYDYTNKAGWTRLKEDTITLPVTDESANTESPEPDWEYMENYIKGIEKQERENRSLREAQEERILRQLASRM